MVQERAQGRDLTIYYWVLHSEEDGLEKVKRVEASSKRTMGQIDISGGQQRMRFTRPPQH